MTEAAAGIPFFDATPPDPAVLDEMCEAAERIIRRGDFTLGHDVGAFEDEFAAYCEARFAVGVGSGTDALQFALMACGVGLGDEVITAANTFVATLEAIIACGARPVLADIDERTYNLDPVCVARAITPRTKAIVPVHLYGQVADMSPLIEVAYHNKVVIVEDACQAHGARYGGRRAGRFGRAAAFSFYPTKNLGACGDGGMVVTDDPGVAEATRLLRNHGERGKYRHVAPGRCSRLHNLQAAVLRIKLRHLDEWNRYRRRAAAVYDSLLGDAVGLPAVAAACEHVYHLYVVRTSRRDDLRDTLAAAGIGTGIHYPVPAGLQPAFARLRVRAGSFPVAAAAAGEILSLPMYPGITEDDLHGVAFKINEFAKVGQETVDEMRSVQEWSVSESLDAATGDRT